MATKKTEYWQFSEDGQTWCDLPYEPNPSWAFRRKIEQTNFVPNPVHPGELVLNRIRAKATLHKKANRFGFTAVFVKLQDWKDLGQYIWDKAKQSGNWPENMVQVCTDIGWVKVWPLNDDGCTFAD